ncbi:MlaD family protein [Nocardia sp. NPDC003482]
MPGLRGWRARLTPKTERGNEIRWGLAGICGVLLLIAAIGVVYTTGTTPERTYRADMAQAGAIRPGDDVRVAGIPVGKVKSLTLLADRVRMTFTVDSTVFVGDQTTLDLRMLTIVGGYYVAVEPSGAKPLGSTIIPSQRVVLPYNLTQAFQDAIEPVRKVDGDTLRRNLAALASSVDRSPDALRAAVQAVSDVVGLMDKQNADISHTLSIADEYLAALDANSTVLAQFVTTLRTLENIVEGNKTAVHQAVDDLAVVLHDFSPLGRLWDEQLKAKAQPLADAMPKLQELANGLGSLLDSLRGLEQRVLPLLPPGGGVTIDQSGTTIQPAAFCVPVPGGGC